jgi:hypothetical protein
MVIQLAHIHAQGIDFAVFSAEAISHSNSDRSEILHRLTAAARSTGLRIDKSALAFTDNGKWQFYGTDDLIQYLAHNGLPQWTHTITV